MTTDITVRPTGTSWGSVIDGWLASVGVAAILTPLVGLLLASLYPNPTSYASTVPVLAGVGLAYLVGGYVAGRMAGYRTSWHGMMSAFFGLFVILALLVVGMALQSGALGVSGTLVDVIPGVLGVGMYHAADTFAFGGALSLLVAIFAGWTGGLLAPTRVERLAPVAPVVPVEQQRTVQTEVRRPVRERFRLLPAAGSKGGERVDEVAEPERTEPV